MLPCGNLNSRTTYQVSYAKCRAVRLPLSINSNFAAAFFDLMGLDDLQTVYFPTCCPRDAGSRLSCQSKHLCLTFWALLECTLTKLVAMGGLHGRCIKSSDERLLQGSAGYTNNGVVHATANALTATIVIAWFPGLFDRTMNNDYISIQNRRMVSHDYLPHASCPEDRMMGSCSLTNA
eukprot:scaffold91893_cov44-Prasinocladus_malaysianus.AAC.2